MQFVERYRTTHRYSHARHESAWTIQKGPKNRPLFWTGSAWHAESLLAARFDTEAAAARHWLAVPGARNATVRIAEHWWQVR